jgi:hypothetical protein
MAFSSCVLPDSLRTISGGVGDPDDSAEFNTDDSKFEPMDFEELLSIDVGITCDSYFKPMYFERPLCIDVWTHSALACSAETRVSTMEFTPRSRIWLYCASMVRRNGHHRMDGEFLLGISLCIVQHSSLECLFQPQVLELGIDCG